MLFCPLLSALNMFLYAGANALISLKVVGEEVEGIFLNPVITLTVIRAL